MKLAIVLILAAFLIATASTLEGCKDTLSGGTKGCQDNIKENGRSSYCRTAMGRAYCTKTCNLCGQLGGPNH